MASYTVVQYLQARLPNLATDLPGVSADMLAMGAMAVYWSFFMSGKDPVPVIDDALLTERQKIVCALRAAVTIYPTILSGKASKMVTEGTGGPATAKFADPSKVYKQILDAMTAELELMETAEGVMLKPGEWVPPANLLTVNKYNELLTADLVVSRNIFDLGWV